MKKLFIGCLVSCSVAFSLSAADTFNTNSCSGCHGKDFSKSALNKSKIVKDMSNKDIRTALKGYKNGTYGGPMKALMKNQVKKYSDSDLDKIADFIKPEDTNSTKEVENVSVDNNTTK